MRIIIFNLGVYKDGELVCLISRQRILEVNLHKYIIAAEMICSLLEERFKVEDGAYIAFDYYYGGEE